MAASHRHRIWIGKFEHGRPTFDFGDDYNLFDAMDARIWIFMFASDMLDVYSSPPWIALCAEAGKQLKIEPRACSCQ